jgi:hypothetical protein
MSSKSKEYKVNDRAEKAAHFLIACKQANPATKVKVTEAMQVKMYSDLEAMEMMNTTGEEERATAIQGDENKDRGGAHRCGTCLGGSKPCKE